MCRRMNSKCFFWGVVLVALLMGVLSVTLPLQLMGQLILVTRFFEIMIPVLAVGALLKYLCGCSSCKCASNGNSCGKTDNTTQH